MNIYIHMYNMYNNTHDTIICIVGLSKSRSRSRSMKRTKSRCIAKRTGNKMISKNRKVTKRSLSRG